MKKNILLLCTSLLLILFKASCDKDDKPDKDSELISFSALIPDKDSIAVGESTMITAMYEGTGVKFEWETSSGKLQGSGHEVEYIVAFCDIGINTITCKASAANKSELKTINIKVYAK
jgi:hypothetical protein